MTHPSPSFKKPLNDNAALKFMQMDKISRPAQISSISNEMSFCDFHIKDIISCERAVISGYINRVGLNAFLNNVPSSDGHAELVLNDLEEA